MKHYDVFISYSRKDSEIVDQIYYCLEEKNISAFIDREGISGGEEFSPKLAEQIKDSTLFLFIGSKSSYYESKWTPKELHFALKHKESNAIIPYLIDDEVMPEKIEFALADINILNIKEHPINERLVEDIKNALEKLRPNDKDTKEDIKTAKSIAEMIDKSSHDVEDNIKFLIELGRMNSSRFARMGTRKERFSEAEIYYTKALELFDNCDSKELNASYKYYDIYRFLARIKKEKGKYEEAENLYQKFIEFTSTPGLQQRFNDEQIDSFIGLAEVQCLLKKFDSVNSNCEKAKELLTSNNRRYGTIEKAKRLVEIQVKALREQDKNEEAKNIQDDILTLFRNYPADDDDFDTFSELLVAFADSNKKSKQFEIAKKYLEEANNLDENNMDIMMSLAETYDALERKTDAYEMYQNAFSTMLKQSDASSRRFYYTNLARSLGTIVAFLDKNKYYDEIDRCYQLSIAKFQLSIYNDSVNSPQIGNIYEPYADWLISRNRFNEAKKYLNYCLDIVDSMDDNDKRTDNLFRVKNKIALIYYHLGLLEKAIEEVKEAINKSRGEQRKSIYYVGSLFESIFSMWEEYNAVGFVEGANLLKNHVIEDLSNMKFDNPSEKARYFTALGWYLLQMREFDAASKPLEDALKLEEKQKKDNKSSIANAKNNLALLYINTQNFDKAEKLLKEAAAVFEKLATKDETRLHNFAESQNYFGQLSMAKGNYAEAEEYFVESVNNYTKAATINKRYMKDVEETTILLEKAKAMQNFIEK